MERNILQRIFLINYNILRKNITKFFILVRVNIVIKNVNVFHQISSDTYAYFLEDKRNKRTLKIPKNIVKQKTN